MTGSFNPTEEQNAAVSAEGSAFVTACPGAGKTRVMVERARYVLSNPKTEKALAFLSFTNAAISELEKRLRNEAVFDTVPFPHFVGTFDAFLWQFVVAPFGISGVIPRPRLIPDLESISVIPYNNARAMPLFAFSAVDGKAIPEALTRQGFGGNIQPYETAAANIRKKLYERGDLDFQGARRVACEILANPEQGPGIISALSSRFQEMIVDEAQDCDPVDLEILYRFKSAGLPVKIICDPHQSIYGFRGGVADELLAFGKKFADSETYSLTGNFRSSAIIANAVVAFRGINHRDKRDSALGKNRDLSIPVTVIGYSGRSVPSAIGDKFSEIVVQHGLEPADCPVIASTSLSCRNAVGLPDPNGSGHLSVRLATTITRFQYSFELGNIMEILKDLHRIVLEICGGMGSSTYHGYLSDTGLEPTSWRPQVVAIAEELKFRTASAENPTQWLERARNLFQPMLQNTERTINQLLANRTELADILACSSASRHPAKTIHSVKGHQFPAVCVVLSPSKATKVFNHLITAHDVEIAEEARKLYVGASRAEQLLTIAVPKSQIDRVHALLKTMTSAVEVVRI
jgi:DNA helicase II / ATP-dependent DNA helicase PcrA